MNNAYAVLLFILGLALLVLGGKLFVWGAEDISRRFKVSRFLMGATVLSICTTLPEVVVSARAAVQGNSGLAYGNALGSVICNASLIAGAIIVLNPAKVKQETFSRGTAFFFIAGFFYATMAWTVGRFDRWVGMVLLAVFAAFEIVLVLYMNKHHESLTTAPPHKDVENVPEKPKKKTRILKPHEAVGILVVGAAAIAIGARLLVNNGTIVAKALGVPDSVIGLTMVALGTSLPELITAIQSRIKGIDELWIGNIVGANVLNLVLVCGLAITISPFDVPAGRTIGGINASLVVDIPLMLLAMAVLCLPSLFKGKVMRWQGILLLCVYAAFNVYQFVW